MKQAIKNILRKLLFKYLTFTKNSCIIDISKGGIKPTIKMADPAHKVANHYVREHLDDSKPRSVMGYFYAGAAKTVMLSDREKLLMSRMCALNTDFKRIIPLPHAIEGT